MSATAPGRPATRSAEPHAGSSDSPTGSTAAAGEGHTLRGMSQPVPIEVVEEGERRAAGLRWLMMPDVADPLRLEDIIRRPAWMARAASRGEPHATFFLGLGGSPKRGQAICSIFPVRAECLGHAMADRELVGWWAGTSEQQRAKMRRAAGQEGRPNRRGGAPREQALKCDEPIRWAATHRILRW